MLFTHQSASCEICGRRSPLISARLGVCGRCIRARPDQALPIARAVHARGRQAFALPPEAPRAAAGRLCTLCAHECRIEAGQRGFCGLRTVHNGRLVHLGGTARRGVLQWYRDALPTNCVADWVCSGHLQSGCHNLAVFYASCTLDCLFCQNWQFREISPRGEATGPSALELSEAADSQTYCVCFFGGDPASQMPHALGAARHLAKKGVVVCWETAGTSHPKVLDRALELSLSSGGCLKFDLKAHDGALHIALTGCSNKRSFENFARAVGRFGERGRPPPVVASTLLVPGYVGEREVGRIARFIAGLNPDVPYALLAFAPHFYMQDLPRTSRRHAESAAAAAREAGLTNVRIGNPHLLADEY
jgi:pyruvate formate lyase activating enzyme